MSTPERRDIIGCSVCNFQPCRCPPPAEEGDAERRAQLIEDLTTVMHALGALSHALVGETGLSAIMEASKHAKMRKAAAALKAFPLPAQSATSQENYQRILRWLYSEQPDVASLIIDLEFGE